MLTYHCHENRSPVITQFATLRSYDTLPTYAACSNGEALSDPIGEVQGMSSACTAKRHGQMYVREKGEKGDLPVA